MDKIPTAFISYSWDSEEHQRWVINFTNKLRENGILATIDVFETQKGTTNLNTMMLESIRDNDFTIVILTENYATKADLLQGGVGAETKLLLNYIQENEEKIIPVIKSNDVNKPIPFYLKGMSYIDFSNGEEFEKSFKELIHRIYKVDLFKRSNLGPRPNLETVDTSFKYNNNFNDIEYNIPSFKEFTDLEKNKFIREKFKFIVDGLENFLEGTKQKNKEFDFEREDITSRKTLYKLYLNGNIKTSTKIWMDSDSRGGNESIKLSYDNYSISSDNSYNENIICEVDESNNLVLKMIMNLYGKSNTNTAKLVLKEIWDTIISRV